MSKKIVGDYIRPKRWPLYFGGIGFGLGILLLVIGAMSPAFAFIYISAIPLLVGLFSTLPAMKRASNAVTKLEYSRQLDRAAEELTGQNVAYKYQNRAACTEHFFFVRNGALALNYEDIQWAYKHTHTTRYLFITVSRQESVILCTRDKKYTLHYKGKDKTNEQAEFIVFLKQKNPNMLVGYTKETQDTYKRISLH